MRKITLFAAMFAAFVLASFAPACPPVQTIILPARHYSPAPQLNAACDYGGLQPLTAGYAYQQQRRLLFQQQTGYYQPPQQFRAPRFVAPPVQFVAPPLGIVDQTITQRRGILGGTTTRIRTIQR